MHATSTGTGAGPHPSRDNGPSAGVVPGDADVLPNEKLSVLPADADIASNEVLGVLPADADVLPNANLGVLLAATSRARTRRPARLGCTAGAAARPN